MTKQVKKFTKNYNGQEIKTGEVMVPFEFTELDAENCINPECIKTVSVGPHKAKVIYKAVGEKWEKKAKSALNLVTNEKAGKYDFPNSFSMDGARDDYELECATTPSIEEIMIQREEFNENVRWYVDEMQELIGHCPKMGYAVLLVQSQVKGEAFYDKMLLSRGAANRIRQQAEEILFEGLKHLDITAIKCYKSPHDDVYREEAMKLLAAIVSEL